MQEPHAHWMASESASAPLLNGLVVAPTLNSFLRRGIFDFMAKDGQQESTRLRDIAVFAVGSDAHRFLGVLSGAFRTLALQGWIAMKGLGEETALCFTPQGQRAVSIARANRDTLNTAISSVRYAKHYHSYLRNSREDDAAEALELYSKLIEESRNEWNIGDYPDAASRRVAEQLRMHLDGLLLCPTMVALGMPVFGARVAGMVQQVGQSVFDMLKHESDFLLNAEIHHSFLHAAFDLLVTHGIMDTDSQRTRFVLTEWGEKQVETASQYGVVVSYLESIEHLDQILFQNPVASHTHPDSGVNRIMNVWGSGDNQVSHVFQDDICSHILKPIFDHPDLERQPAGIADMGCGSGVPLRSLANFVVTQTRRGKCLERYPLFIVGGDISQEARCRASATLSDLREIRGLKIIVLEADFSDPAKFDTVFHRLGLSQGRDGAAISGGRCIGIGDLLHTQMFIVHNRTLAPWTQKDALSVLRASIQGLNHFVLEDALARLIRTEVVVPTDVEKLCNLVISKFTTDCSENGRLVPAVAVAADLVQTIERWRPYLSQGLITIEPHVPRLDVTMEETPQDRTSLSRADIDPAPWVWGVHYLSNQYLMPHLEHELAFVLAGLVPVRSIATGTGSISLSYWARSEQVYFDPPAEWSDQFNFGAILS